MGLLFGVDLFAVDEDIQCPRSAHSQPDRDVKFTLDIVFKAHGPSFDVASEEAAFDFDAHTLLFPLLTQCCNRVSHTERYSSRSRVSGSKR